MTGIVSRLKGTTLVIPSISVGNVPQLTVDLLLHNFDFKLVTHLDSQLLYPFASPVDYTDGHVPPPGSVSTALEVYFDEERKLAMIQQRSPILPGFGKNFLDYISQWIKDSQFGKVVVIDSNDCTLRTNLDVQNPVEIFSNDLNEQFKQFTIEQQENEELSFSAYSKALIDNLKEYTTVFAIVMFVYEGDNRVDSSVLGMDVLKLLTLDQPVEWKQPKSWDALYGDRPLPLGLEEGIYG